MRADRRSFLRSLAATGVCFCPCGLGRTVVRAAQAVAERGRVVIGGRAVRTIDMHSHVYVSEVWPLVRDLPQVDRAMAALTGSAMAIDAATLGRRFAEMDRQRIDVHVISVHPSQFLYFAAPDLAARVVRIQNEAIAGLCAAHPDRFVGLGNVSLQQADLAVEQLDYAIGTLKLRGVIVGANVEGDELVAPRLDPFWRRAEALGAVVLLHPAGFNDAGKRLGGAGALGNNIGFPLDTTIALSHMIFEGFLDRFPRVRIVAAHGGGFLGSYIGRFDNCRDLQAPCQRMQRKPSEYLRGPQLSFDSLVYSTQNLRHLATTVGAGQIVIGTDFGFPIASTTPVELVLQTPGLSAEEQTAILGGNAARLLKL